MAHTQRSSNRTSIRATKNPGHRNGTKNPAPQMRPIITAPALIENLVLRAKRVQLSEKPAHQRPITYVLDTNVLMHDPLSLFRFQEHVVYISRRTRWELDHNKSGNSEAIRNARQASRLIEEILKAHIEAGNKPDDLIPLKDKFKSEEGAPTGYLQLQLERIPYEKLHDATSDEGDAIIRNVTKYVAQHNPKRVVKLVTKDRNMRIEALMDGILVEDYKSDQVPLEDKDYFPNGICMLPENFWEHHGKGMESWKTDGATYYRLRGPLVPSLSLNQFVVCEPEGETPLYAMVREKDETDPRKPSVVLQTVKDYMHQKHNVWGITARNREQNFALNLLMNPEIPLVTLLGQAGTGKTLLTLAAGLMLTLEFKVYTEIIMTRVTVPVGEDIGFLPGTEEEKMNPWMGALEDNLDVLNKTDDEAGEWGRAATRDLIRSRVKVKSLNFMRGRTFINKFLVIDEAQNLTPKQMKTLITRAGPGTKAVCLGNLAQIDTPYLTEGNSGLTYLVDRFKGQKLAGHVTLQRGERSPLADLAAELL